MKKYDMDKVKEALNKNNDFGYEYRLKAYPNLPYNIDMYIGDLNQVIDISTRLNQHTSTVRKIKKLIVDLEKCEVIE